MGGVTEEIAAQGCLLFLDTSFRAEHAGQELSESQFAFEAAKFTLHVLHQSGEIDNFGSDPTIEELQETIIKLTRNQGE